MSTTNDPRNIFVDNRNGFAEGDSSDNSASNRQTQESSSGDGEQSTYQQRVEQMKQLAAKYQRDGEGQLVRDIINNVIEQKAAGKLTNEQLKQFATRIMPLLNAEQKQRLGQLLEQLLQL